MHDPLEQFLERSGTHQVRHSGRSLYQHLRGTEQLLREWGRSEAVCRAGLFHSIYGTNAFTYQSAALKQRTMVADLLGAQSEHLVYLFHALHRPWALIEAISAGGSASRLDGQFLILEEPQLMDLIEIECANLLDQGSGQEFFAALYDELGLHGVVLDAAIMCAISAA